MLLIVFVIRNVVIVVIIVVSVGDGGASFDDHERVVEWEGECGSSGVIVIIMVIVVVYDKVESCREHFLLFFVRGNL